MNKSFSTKVLATILLVAIFISPALGQQPPADPANILNNINTQTTAASGILKLIFATIAWIFLGLGIVMIIYSAIVDSQRMKFGIISFLAAALILAVGYGVGLF